MKSSVKQILGCILAALLSAGAPNPVSVASSQPEYAAWFTDAAMRVDLFHTGTNQREGYSLDGIVAEPLWPGARRYLIDPFGYGAMRFRVVDQASGSELFRLGFSTLFNEWTSTPEAMSGIARSMHESVRFPWPKKSVLLHIDKRSTSGTFEELFQLVIDPSSHQISRGRPHADARILELSAGPAPSNALDIVIVPDGYAVHDAGKLESDARRFVASFFEHAPWSDLRSTIRFRAVLAFSPESGATEPRKAVFRHTLLGTSFNTFDSPRYLTLPHTKTLREVASVVPYDAIFVMVNSSRYGGGGVYNQWSVFTSDNEYDDYVMAHEFGHHMGGLADEYYSSSTGMDEDEFYPKGVEPWEPNITAFLDGKRESIKWAGLIDPSTPVPTLPSEEFSNKTGLFEGAGYKSKGLYRSQSDCMMFHKGKVPLCKVCQQSLKAMVRYYTGEDL